MSETKRRRWMVIMIAVIMAVLLVEGVVVASVFVSPQSADRLRGVAVSVGTVWSGKDGQPGLRTNLARGFAHAYNDWIGPLWGSPDSPPPSEEFSTCVGCHKDYAQLRRFSSVYMNHPVHAQLGVACATCHTKNQHPNPPRPEEKTCATCHDEVQDPNACSSCHPPGSLAHFYLLGASRDAAVQCDTCHPPNFFAATATVPLVTGTQDGSDPSTCRQCHAVSTCTQCHAAPHPQDWLKQHGTIAGQSGLTECYTCHTSAWCGTRCHSVTSSNPFVKQPLPSVGVQP